jgi:hypothetical protein
MREVISCQCKYCKAGQPLLTNVRATAQLVEHLSELSEIVIIHPGATGLIPAGSLWLHFCAQKTAEQTRRFDHNVTVDMWSILVCCIVLARWFDVQSRVNSTAL